MEAVFDCRTELANAILSGSAGGDITLETLNVSQNGTQNAPEGTAYNKVVTSVPVPTLESKSISVNGTYTPESGKAWNEVAVNVPSVFETGTVAYHTGTAEAELIIPVSAAVEEKSRYVVAIRPIKTWVLVDGVWTERDSLDFTGTTGFKSGNWNPAVLMIVGAKQQTFSGAGYYRKYVSMSHYSNGTNGSPYDQSFTYEDSTSLKFPSFNGGKVCVSDCGLTFQYDIWGWDE